MKEFIRNVYYRLNGWHKVSKNPSKYDDYYVCTIHGCGFILLFDGVWHPTRFSGEPAYWRKLPKLPKSKYEHVIYKNK